MLKFQHMMQRYYASGMHNIIISYTVFSLISAINQEQTRTNLLKFVRIKIFYSKEN